MSLDLAPGRPIVVKVGSSSLIDDGGRIDEAAIARTAASVAVVGQSGHPVVLVTSGAVAVGMAELGLDRRPTDLADLQVAAAIGQGRLMHKYSEAFGAHGLTSGQVLLTRDVLAHRDQYLHARRAIQRMLERGVIPIVNENDTVGVDELRLGDNDRLAAIVSHLSGAALLVLLTDTEGLFSADPRHGRAEFLAAVDHADIRLDELDGVGQFGSGGVASKVSAARIAAFSAIPTVVASARTPLADTLAERSGTWVDPRPKALAARKLWIAFCLPVRGTVAVDAGAVRAVAEAGSSLLPVGITRVEGVFRPGDAVDVVGPEQGIVGRGLARMGSQEMSENAGVGGGGAALHRDDLVVF